MIGDESRTVESLGLAVGSRVVAHGHCHGPQLATVVVVEPHIKHSVWVKLDNYPCDRPWLAAVRWFEVIS